MAVKERRWNLIGKRYQNGRVKFLTDCKLWIDEQVFFFFFCIRLTLFYWFTLKSGKHSIVFHTRIFRMLIHRQGTLFLPSELLMQKRTKESIFRSRVDFWKLPYCISFIDHTNMLVIWILITIYLNVILFFMKCDAFSHSKTKFLVVVVLVLHAYLCNNTCWSFCRAPYLLCRSLCWHRLHWAQENMCHLSLLIQVWTIRLWRIKQIILPNVLKIQILVMKQNWLKW